MRRETPFGIGTLLISVLLSLTFAEGVLRTFFAQRFALADDERSLAYRHDPELGWFPLASSEREIQGTRLFHARHNARGFRDPEHGPKTRPRLVVLGDSFVWGFDVEAEERFTERLRERLPDVDVANLGVSGFGTDQTLLLFQQQASFYAPDVVLLIFAAENDREDNVTNRRYGPYYKPYFERGARGLELRGVPVPRGVPYLLEQHPWLGWSALARAAYQGGLDLRHPVVEVADPSEALVLALRDAARAQGARFLLGVQGRDAALLAFARDGAIPAVELVTRERYPHFGGHWTPEGHAYVAERLLGLLEPLQLGRGESSVRPSGAKIRERSQPRRSRKQRAEVSSTPIP